MSDWKKITPADLAMLPAGYQQRIPERYFDDFKDMNVILSRITSRTAQPG
jgi:hypothetical protein